MFRSIIPRGPRGGLVGGILFMYETLKFLHIMAVILFGGTALVDGVTGPMMARAKSVVELRTLTRISRLNQFLAIVFVLSIPVFGYLTASELDIALDTTWLLVSQVLFWIAVLVGFGYLAPAALRLARKVESLPDGPIPDDVARETQNPLFPVLGFTLTVFFVVIVYLMVAKPEF
jgi:uncharacterized membrane protein